MKNYLLILAAFTFLIVPSASAQQAGDRIRKERSEHKERNLNHEKHKNRIGQTIPDVAGEHSQP